MTFLFIITTIIIIVVVSKRNKKRVQQKAFEAEKAQMNENKTAYLNRIGYSEQHKYLTTIDCDIAGVHIDDRTTVCIKCKAGDELMLSPEPDNIYDSNAIEIFRFNGEKLGYVPASYTEEIIEKLNSTSVFRCYFDKYLFNGSFFSAYIKINEYKK